MLLTWLHIICEYIMIYYDIFFKIIIVSHFVWLCTSALGLKWKKVMKRFINLGINMLVFIV